MSPLNTQPEVILDGGVGKRLAYVQIPSNVGKGPTQVPLAVVVGKHDGPTVWINSALHGDEYLGPAVVARLVRGLEPARVHGRVILTPTLNVAGVEAMQRTAPDDPTDLNRVWNAGQDASRPAAVAWADVVLERSDFVLDLHSGGNRYLQRSFAGYASVGGRVDRDSSALAKACRVPWVWAHRGSILEPALITAAAKRGKPAVLLEMAGEGKAETAWVDEMSRAIRRALVHLKVLGGRAAYASSYRVFEGFEIVRNREGGLWTRAVDPGDAVGVGSPLGRVTDLLGQEKELVTSTRDGAVAGICTYGYVPPADYLAELAYDFHDEGPPS